ncbi:MAG: Eco57I restriction-modification methylase domain-containing protein [Ignavibacteriales bacterium]|nr:Eco57I restriction-modification methylase domain-containing protein [Ignavibacteriales bacterium]
MFKPHRILDSGDFHAPDDHAFADICQKLADPSSPYDFNQIPISILGSIYERFLGKVVHATDKRVKVEEKPEVRKAGGVYYTPEYIVRYIVTETVGKLIEGKTPVEISTMAFADIACGSGSFLIEVYGQLCAYHLQYYVDHSDKPGKDDIFSRDGTVHLSLKKKKEILCNNVFGVDIDFQATEVTQLSLYLKMLEDATMNDAYQFGLFKETILPDLRQNIVCGNSLIGRDIVDGSLFADVDEAKLKPMNFEDAFPKIMKRGGFDAVVGNPPYVRQELLINLKSYLEATYKVYHGTSDLYTYFIEKGILLLRDGGLFSIIVANKWMRANYGEPLRRWLADQCVLQLIDFGDLPVFQGISTYPSIIVVSRARPVENINTTIVESLESLELSEYVGKAAFSVPRSQLRADGWSLTDRSSSMLLDKLNSTGIALADYVNGNIFYGIKTGLNEAFVINGDTKKKLLQQDPSATDLIKPFLAGRVIKRYASPMGVNHLILIPNGFTNTHSSKTKDKWGWLKDKYPAIATYLQTNEEIARKRYDQGEFWWEQRPCEYLQAFEKPKIIVPAIVKNASYAYDLNRNYSNDKTCIIPTSDLYLLALMNSKVCDYYLHSIASTKQGGYFEYKSMYVGQLPIRRINYSDPADNVRHDHIVRLVEQMLDSKKKLGTAKTEAETNRLETLCATIDRQIDEAVYELYGLTEEEIKIVEGKE